MKKVTRTAIAGMNIIAREQNIPQVVPKHTTFNEHLSIAEELQLKDGEYTSFKGIMIGNGAHIVKMTDSQIAYFPTVAHRPMDTNLYNTIPVVLRREDDDLTLEQQKGYGLRTRMQYRGVWYIAYFLKRIDVEDPTIKISRVRVVDGEEKVDLINFTSEDANPTKPNLNLDTSAAVETLEDDYVAVDNIVEVPLTQFDIQELINVCNIVEGIDSMAIFSELAIVHGVDRNVDVAGPTGEPYTFREVAVAQAVAYICEFKSYSSIKDEDVITFNVGVTESLLTEHQEESAPNAVSEL
tara:strand:- start:59294 stop:60181 length:888 start_codon:yes stop_codon:yes gene_type:complete